MSSEMQATFKRDAWRKFRNMRFGERMRNSDRIEAMGLTALIGSALTAVMVAIGAISLSAVSLAGAPVLFGIAGFAGLASILFTLTYVVRSVEFRSENAHYFGPAVQH